MKRLLVFLLLGCTAMSSLPLPSDPAPSQTVLATGMPAGVTATSLIISPNPAAVSIGQTQRLTVSMKLSNGKTSTDPTWVRWSLGDPQAAVISAQGVVTPKLPRTTKIVAEVSSLKVEIPLTVEQAGYNWQQVDSPTTKDLYGVKMLSSQEAWAIGDDSTLLHLVNSYWQGVQTPDAGVQLRGIDFSDNANGWLVGHYTTGQVAIWRYISGNWVRFPQTQAGTLYAVNAVDSTHAWAVGEDNNGKILIMRYSGAGWIKDSTYSASGCLRALHMMGSIGWAVGSSGSKALVLKYENNDWSEEGVSPLQSIEDALSFTSAELTGVQMLDSQQGYAVGYRKGLLYKTGLVLKYDARGGWTNLWHWSDETPSDDQIKSSYLCQVPLNGLYLTSGSGGWLLGETVDPFKVGTALTKVYGNLLDWDGTTYRLDTTYRKTNLSTKFQAIDVLPSGEGVIVGTGGYLMQRKYDWQGS